MEQIHQIMFEEKTPPAQLVGRKLTCPNCGQENEIEDALDILPTTYLVSSANSRSKAKSNEELKNWLNAE